MGTIIKHINNFERYAVVALMSVLVCGLSYSSLVRYFATSPYLTQFSFIAEELSLFAFVWMLYLGAAIAAREGSHFRVTAQFAFLPKSWFRWRFLVADIIWLGFCLYVVWQGIGLVESAIERPEPSLATQAPMWLIYAIIPLSFGLTFLRVVQVYLNGENGIDRNSEFARSGEE